MLDIFTCSDLILCIFHFFTGLPRKTKEEEEMEDYDDDDGADISSYRSSRLSLSIQGSHINIGRKLIGGKKSMDAFNAELEDIDTRERFEGTEKNGNMGILNHWKFRMNQINFETKNK